MRTQSVDQWINLAASTLGFLACAFFATTYHTKAPWWRTLIGWNLMSFAVAVGILCAYTVLITIWPAGCTGVILRSIRTAVVLAIAGLMVQRTILLLRAQSEHEHRD